jgi:hypothetical protein
MAEEGIHFIPIEIVELFRITVNWQGSSKYLFQVM